MRKLTSLLLALAIIVLTSGCASVISGTTQLVTVKTNPDGAKATFYDKKGEAVSSQTTPCTVSLKRSGKYSLKIEKAEYATLETQLTRGVNGWYFGNIIFGGIIGILIVDPATGAMWSFYPNELRAELAHVDSGKPSIIVKPAVSKTAAQKKTYLSRGPGK